MGDLQVKHVHRELLDNLKEKHKGNVANSAVVATCLANYQAFIAAFDVARRVPGAVVAAAELDRYLDYAKSLEVSNPILGPRTKYYSSILEEMPVLLCESVIRAYLGQRELKAKLVLGGRDCVIRVGANPDGTPFFEKKRIDFCLALLGTMGPDMAVPLVGFEVKKYLDKTMFGTVLETYKSLQLYRPRTKYGFLVEDEARAEDVVRNSQMYASEFVLTGTQRNESFRNKVDATVLSKFAAYLEAELIQALAEVP